MFSQGGSETGEECRVLEWTTTKTSLACNRKLHKTTKVGQEHDGDRERASGNLEVYCNRKKTIKGKGSKRGVPRGREGKKGRRPKKNFLASRGRKKQRRGKKANGKMEREREKYYYAFGEET